VNQKAAKSKEKKEIEGVETPIVEAEAPAIEAQTGALFATGWDIDRIF
jgi:hypothetical protein